MGYNTVCSSGSFSLSSNTISSTSSSSSYVARFECAASLELNVKLVVLVAKIGVTRQNACHRVSTVHAQICMLIVRRRSGLVQTVDAQSDDFDALATTELG